MNIFLDFDVFVEDDMITNGKEQKTNLAVGGGLIMAGGSITFKWDLISGMKF